MYILPCLFQISRVLRKSPLETFYFVRFHQIIAPEGVISCAFDHIVFLPSHLLISFFCEICYTDVKNLSKPVYRG